ncbi:hypothetical protein A3J33_04185 [candidate division WWE3 bacterium RIFCSPLOWO2_02_FULL_53_10]|uniref:30S ribosomal protein S16 n=1 Tax=candidate division WWE3 bacterium RIFCSPLOWO2_02_FULL_53_10 TaxID=1802629 RepID=A0A1F4W7Y1_UNCKA|nr:MAG: hypothetical protein A3J33_04185 [candidate division WWE3 bacterium RIFCSPLOWO2_02_FULL_53_10]
MLVIKLVRYGKKNLPSFRVAVTEKNKIVEFLGSYYPHPKSPQLNISKELLEKWKKSGAKLTPAVENLVKGKYEFKKYVPKKAESQEIAAPTSPQPTVEPEKPKEVSSEKSSPASENSEQPNA